MRHTSSEGIALIKQFEGLRLTAYYCSANVLTIGYGSTRGVTAGMRITEAEADARLVADLHTSERAVLRLITVPLSDGQFAALVSFTFNLGAGALQRSTLRQKLNRGEYDAIPSELLKWVFAGGKKLAGLKRRREAEAALWMSEEEAPFAPVPQEKPYQPPVVNYPSVKSGWQSWFLRIFN